MKTISRRIYTWLLVIALLLSSFSMMGFSAASDATNDSAILDENLIVAQELNEKKKKEP